MEIQNHTRVVFSLKENRETKRKLGENHFYCLAVRETKKKRKEKKLNENIKDICFPLFSPPT